MCSLCSRRRYAGKNWRQIEQLRERRRRRLLRQLRWCGFELRRQA